MGKNSAIEWTGHTWNPWRGCHKVSQGCKHCYMFREQNRYGRDPNVVVRSKTTFNDPLKWSETALVFTCSWSDFFIEEADPWRDEAWEIIRKTPHLTYQILTKRPENIKDRLPLDWGRGWRNVWLGVSAENQMAFDIRIYKLIDVPALTRFVSAEPLLGPIDFAKDIEISLLRQWFTSTLPLLDWVIVGGESGPNHRPMKLEWVRDILKQCDEYGIAPFVKQLGGWPDKRGDISKFPEDLRIREFPK